ncbi:MAG: RNA-binding cell elongation regulator Jag/EloR [bacterium]
MAGSVKMKGKSVEEAITMALQVLGKTREEVDIKILTEAEGGVLGVFGGKEAEVEVSPKGALGEEARAVVQEILDKMGFLTLVSIKQEEGDTIHLDIKGEDMGRIIGRAGAALDSLQFLASLILSKKHSTRVRALVDAEGYREKRQKVVTQDADIIAKEVEKTGSEKPMPPMSAADRRVIHMYIQENFPNLTSFSRGEGQGRQLVIAPSPEASAPPAQKTAEQPK